MGATSWIDEIATEYICSYFLHEIHLKYLNAL